MTVEQPALHLFAELPAPSTYVPQINPLAGLVANPGAILLVVNHGLDKRLLGIGVRLPVVAVSSSQARPAIEVHRDEVPGCA